MKNLFCRRTAVAVGVHSVIFVCMLLLYTTLVYAGIVPCVQYAGMICVGIASLTAGLYAAAGQRERIWRACLAAFLPMLAWGILAEIAQIHEAPDIGCVLKTLGVGMACAVIGAAVSPMKKTSNGKHRKHNSTHRTANYR